MQGQGGAAVGGIITGAVMAGVSRMRRQSNRIRWARNAADDAQTTADKALIAINELIDNGDLIRLGNDQVSDLLLGVSYPGRAEQAQPSAFASVPSVQNRPVFTEDMARSFTAWPGTVNLYGPDGKLINPDQALSGQNFLTGLALGTAETRGFLAGLARQSVAGADANLVGQYFRLAQGFARAAEELFGPAALVPGGLSQDEFTAAWRRFMVAAGAGATDGLLFDRIDMIATPTAVVSNTLVETELGRLVIPASTITRVGERLKFDILMPVISSNGADTFQYRVRLDNIAGTVLYDSSAFNVANNNTCFIQGEVFFGAVGAGGQANWGGSVLISGDAPETPPNPAKAFDTNVAHTLFVTVAYSAADPGNQTRIDYADMWRVRAAA